MILTCKWCFLSWFARIVAQMLVLHTVLGNAWDVTIDCSCLYQYQRYSRDRYGGGPCIVLSNTRGCAGIAHINMLVALRWMVSDIDKSCFSSIHLQWMVSDIDKSCFSTIHLQRMLSDIDKSCFSTIHLQWMVSDIDKSCFSTIHLRISSSQVLWTCGLS